LAAAEADELEAFADLYDAAPTALAARLERFGRGLSRVSRRPWSGDLEPCVLGLGLERPATPEQLDEVVDFFRGLGVEWCAAVCAASRAA